MSASAGVKRSGSSAHPGGRTRLDWIDWIRGLAIVLVVFYHAVTAFVVLDIAPPRWADVVNVVVAPYRMPLLMFLSGTLLSVSLRKPRRQYVIGKLERIGWPYAVWTTVIVVFLVVSSQIFGNGHYGVETVPQILLDPATYTWYLAYLLFFYLVSLWTTPTVRAVSVPILFIVAFAVHDGDGWSRLTFLLGFFFLGDLSSRCPRVWASLSSSWIGVASAAVAVAGTIALSVAGWGGRYQLSTLLGVVALLVVARSLATRVSGMPGSSALTAIGRESIVYYTVHWIVIAAAAHVLALFPIGSANVALAILMFVGLFVPWLCVRASRRWRVVRSLFEFPSYLFSSARREAPRG